MPILRTKSSDGLLVMQTQRSTNRERILQKSSMDYPFFRLMPPLLHSLTAQEVWGRNFLPIPPAISVAFRCIVLKVTSSLLDLASRIQLRVSRLTSSTSSRVANPATSLLY